MENGDRVLQTELKPPAAFNMYKTCSEQWPKQPTSTDSSPSPFGDKKQKHPGLTGGLGRSGQVRDFRLQLAPRQPCSTQIPSKDGKNYGAAKTARSEISDLGLQDRNSLSGAKGNQVAVLQVENRPSIGFSYALRPKVYDYPEPAEAQHEEMINQRAAEDNGNQDSDFDE